MSTRLARTATVAVLLLAALTSTPRAQQAQADQPQRARGRYESSTTAIMVDVVVRDRKGNPVTNLTGQDFELYEDGVLQDIGSFTPVIVGPADAAPQVPVTPGSAATAAAIDGGAANPAEAGSHEDLAPPTARALPVIALVFDRLTPEARALAHTAALKYLGREQEAPTYIGVFGVDLSLQTYQLYTRDTAKLRAAIDEVANSSTSQFGGTREQARDAQSRAAQSSAGMAAAESSVSGGGPGASQGAGNMAGAASQAQFAAMQQRMTQSYETMERDQQGYATTNGLLAVINSMRLLPGRKSVIFLSEGIALPPDVIEQFRSVIDTANRANVSIYTMDAAGLRTESKQAETRDIINAGANAVLNRDPRRDVSDAMSKALERNEDALRLDPNVGLGQLADGTGGILIRETNDLTAGLRRIEEDMRNYYMLTYVPRDDRLDGSFREIAVKVKRPGVEVAARKGYYAVRPSGTPVRTYEATALALLETTPVPNSFPVRAEAVRFPELKRPGLTPVLVNLSLSSIEVQPDDEGKAYHGDFTVLVRFKDQTDAVVQKVSQHYQLRGPLDQMDRVKQGSVLFYREPELPAGVYTMETIVYDALGDKASVRFSTVERPKVDAQTTRVSSLLLIARGEHVSEPDRPAESPFLVGDTLLTPNLGAPLHKSVNKELAFFFTVYPGQPNAQLKATLELMQNGKMLARTPLALATPDASGRIQQVSRLPLASIEPGTYELRVVVADGNVQQTRSVMVRVAE